MNFTGQLKSILQDNAQYAKKCSSFPSTLHEVYNKMNSTVSSNDLVNIYTTF